MFRTTEQKHECPPGMGNGRASSITDLLRHLRDHTTLLVRQEIALAKAEVAKSAKRVARGSAVISAGGACAYLAAFFVLTGITIGLAVGLAALGLEAVHAAWISPLIVGVVLGIAGWVMIQRGRTMIEHTNFKPDRTIETVRENKEWLREKVT